ncbi:hypothetical protein KSP9073_02229 [Kushneria phyllosphaerae]|uniref:Uncharacterized protein n=1 Tax=Kushneria phyllosphaerae TaxID=2100822 RepID=A0A2R8CMS4_9GAMM|nr:hypothetical protein KSP9073_02229 [Kushneria phyllosphaerae]
MSMTYHHYPTFDWRFNHTLAATRVPTAGVLRQGAPRLPSLRCQRIEKRHERLA